MKHCRQPSAPWRMRLIELRSGCYWRIWPKNINCQIRYTAPYNWTLAPLRLSVAARGDALTDPELQQFVERDLRTILAGKPELRNAVRAAYVTASAPSRRFFESVVQQADPRFMTSLKQMN